MSKGKYPYKDLEISGLDPSKVLIKIIVVRTGLRRYSVRLWKAGTLCEHVTSNEPSRKGAHTRAARLAYLRKVLVVER